MSRLPPGGVMPRTSTPPTPMIWKLSSTAMRAKERLDLGHQLVVGAPRAGGLHEDRVARVGDRHGLPDRRDLGLEVFHQQAVEEDV